MIVQALILSAILFVNLILWIAYFKQRKRIRRLKEAFLELKDDNRTLYRTDTKIGEAISDINRKIEFLNLEVERMADKTLDQTVYENALKLINSGSDIETVMKKSGLTRGEVELLLTINVQKQEVNVFS
ncbi:MAG: DUF2802 domain-containing protein [Gammaproteobacteria bacterium]|nr:DUF2802 domain-containing protein [Gammaproteobacteria bacterium]MDH5693017.1 DUF2802 domain-containing protein [Gammaproteobacteria bacterium]